MTWQSHWLPADGVMTPCLFMFIVKWYHSKSSQHPSPPKATYFFFSYWEFWRSTPLSYSLSNKQYGIINLSHWLNLNRKQWHWAMKKRHEFVNLEERLSLRKAAVVGGPQGEATYTVSNSADIFSFFVGSFSQWKKHICWFIFRNKLH